MRAGRAHTLIVPSEKELTRMDSYIEALETELRGYETYGLTDRAAQVREELARCAHETVVPAETETVVPAETEHAVPAKPEHAAKRTHRKTAHS